MSIADRVQKIKNVVVIIRAVKQDESTFGNGSVNRDKIVIIFGQVTSYIDKAVQFQIVNKVLLQFG